ncbi:MAG: aldo/keto reductase [Archangium sp.]|nr:aldo/keto reductase [Archangium sp.]
MAWLRPGELRVGLGVMRLSTERSRSEAHARSVVHAALDEGIRMFDTACAYGLDENDYHHNERWLGKFLSEHPAGAEARVITKGGMRRKGLSWIPDGRASTIEEQALGSREALGREIDLYLLHVPDTKVGLATSVRALKSLKERGVVKAIGLSNVNRTQLDEALGIAEISAVQLGLSVLDDTAIRGGVVAGALLRDVSVLCHSPLGGPKKFASLGTAKWLVEKAQAVGCTPWEWALAQLLSIAPGVVVLPGARRVETVKSCRRAATIDLSAVSSPAPTAESTVTASVNNSGVNNSGTGANDTGASATVRASGAADDFPSPRPSPAGAGAGVRTVGDAASPQRVVLLMGVQGSGKTSAVEKAVRDGLTRLNRDEAGGTLEKLHAKMGPLLFQKQSVVLDNTYVSRAQRGGAIQISQKYGVPVHGVWHDIDTEQAQINIVLRMLAVHDRLLEPAELAKGKTPDSLAPRGFQATVRALEPLGDDEGFASLERVPFARRPWPWKAERPALFIGLDQLDARHRHDAPAEWPRIVIGWREYGLALPEGFINGVCPHPSGPPTCWCRPPFPGFALFHARQLGISFAQSRFVTESAPLKKLFEALQCKLTV